LTTEPQRNRGEKNQNKKQKKLFLLSYL